MLVTLVVIIGGIVFLFGLVQWARSGAVLWDIHELLKHRHSPSSDAAEMETGGYVEKEQKEAVKRSIQHMEFTMDGLLRSSYKLMCAVAVCVWLVVAFTFVLDLFGLNWVDRLGFSSHRFMGNPIMRAGAGVARTGAGVSGTGAGTGARSDPNPRGAARNDRLREMGAGFRR